MGVRPAKKGSPKIEPARQVNIRIEGPVYRALITLAQQEQRSVAQVAKRLLSEGLRRRADGTTIVDDTPGPAVARLAAAGGAFDWLVTEPDLYDDSSGEPL